jgi:hypothetical protein
MPDQDQEISTESFFRIVTTNPPTLNDFRSHEELGRWLFDPARIEEWRGISVYGTIRQARKKARDYPSLGQFIAELHIPDESSISYKRTGHTHSHYTLQGPRSAMLQCVVAVWPADTTETERE